MSRRTTLRTIPAALLAGALALTLAPASPAASAVPQPATAGTTSGISSGATSVDVPVATSAERKKKKRKKKARKRAAGQAGSLTYGPRTYVGGQALTFAGRLPGGRRSISLQKHMLRPGDSWIPVAGFRGTTASDGRFRFQWPAPDMRKMRYRVVASGVATPAVAMDSKAEGIDLWVDGQTRDIGSRTPFQLRAGQAFGITADTTPDIPNRTTVRGTPVFPGRIVTLQRRSSPTVWTDVVRGRADSRGIVRFGNLVAPATGPVVYRVRQEAISSGYNRIGWFASFPMHVAISGGGRVAPTSGRVVDGWSGLRAPAVRSTTSSRRTGPTSTAGSAQKWRSKLYDFDWELGESIASAPNPGRGSWSEYSDGSGRVTRHNGQIVLETKREVYRGGGDFGTVRATMRGNDRAYGRWEQRLRVRGSESGQGEYTMRFELVPASAPDDVCRSVLVAEVRPSSSTMRFGVRNKGYAWMGSRTGSFVNDAPAVAVEVLPGHITWFYNGTPIGTVNNSSVTSGVPLTLRMSMVADGDREMNYSTMLSDWQRGFPHNTSRPVNGPALGAQRASCG